MEDYEYQGHLFKHGPDVRRTPTMYNKPLDKLPHELIELSTGYYFNHPLNRLPSTLKKLRIGYSFNYSLDDLPDLIELLIQGRFNKKQHRVPLRLKSVTKITNVTILTEDAMEILNGLYENFNGDFVMCYGNETYINYDTYDYLVKRDMFEDKTPQDSDEIESD